MKVLIGILCMLALSVGASQLAGAANPGKSGAEDAARVCRSGEQSPRHEHPSNACWTAFDAARAQGRSGEAIDLVRTGCEKYRRADQCLFIAELKLPGEGVMHVKASSGDRETLDAINRASAKLGTWEVEDGEAGVLRRDRPLTPPTAKKARR